MPTVPRRAAAQQQRDRLQGRRLRAAELFAAGVRQAEVARQFGVSAQAVSVWYACWERGGIDSLSVAGRAAPRLSDAQLATVEQALLEGRFIGELWTLDRVALVIEQQTGVRHHRAHIWALLRHRLGWSVQRPTRRAVERDQEAIDRWVKEDWPRIKQMPNDAEPVWSSWTSVRSA
jgi:transposase